MEYRTSSETVEYTKSVSREGYSKILITATLEITWEEKPRGIMHFKRISVDPKARNWSLDLHSNISLDGNTSYLIKRSLMIEYMKHERVLKVGQHVLAKKEGHMIPCEVANDHEVLDQTGNVAKCPRGHVTVKEQYARGADALAFHTLLEDAYCENAVWTREY